MTKRNLAALLGFLALVAAMLFYWYLRPRSLDAAAASMADFSWKKVTQIAVHVASPDQWFTGPTVTPEQAEYTLTCAVGSTEVEDLALLLSPVTYQHKLEDMFRGERSTVQGSQAATVSYYNAAGEIMLSVTLVDGDAYLGGLNGFLYSMKSKDGKLSGAEIQRQLTSYVQAHGQALVPGAA